MKVSAIALLTAFGFATAAMAAEDRGASSKAPGHEMQQDQGRMQGSPNAAGFGKKDGAGDTTGSTGSTTSGSSGSGSSSTGTAKPH
ncbi:hypothetical protein [Methylobacterium organophilum]|uniref:Uncharacterized protein n=1 Tax=Methylobacterium organophilum TaxID=410 RepID=A0ABQ4T1S2_METOR|nr:hypothetical protein [Methylobacterium organophilum]UMY19013.1 hypothetical protein MMB17_06845 [Methylobacterium organophilum]GJE25453.1 hypothetical protein LKMONMHP_0291 [Methylobacterium organophilum]